MQINRKQILPLLTAATAMIVAPYSYATNYELKADGTGNFTKGGTLATTDTLTIAAGSHTHTGPLVVAGTGTNTVTVAEGASVTTSGNNAIITAANATGTTTIGVLGSMIANGTNNAIDMSAQATGPTTLNLNIKGSVKGAIVAPAGEDNEEAIVAVTVENGSLEGNYTGATANVAANSAETFTVTNGSVTATAVTFAADPDSAAAIDLTKNAHWKVANTVKAAGAVTMKSDDGDNTSTGDINLGAASTFGVGTVSKATHVHTGAFDRVGITVANGSKLTVTGTIGATNPSTLAASAITDTTIQQRNHILVSDLANFTTVALADADVVFEKKATTTGVFGTTKDSIVHAKDDLTLGGVMTVGSGTRVTVDKDLSSTGAINSQADSTLIVGGTTTLGAASTYNGDVIFKGNILTSGITVGNAGDVTLSEGISVPSIGGNTGVIRFGAKTTVTGTASNTGVFAISGKGALGAENVVTINGALTSVAGAVLRFDISDSYNVGKLNLLDTLTDFDDTAVVMNFADTAFVAPGEYVLVTATAPATIVAPAVSYGTHGNSKFAHATFANTATAVTATVDRVKSFSDFATDANAKAVFSGMDTKMTKTTFAALNDDQRAVLNAVEGYVNTTANANLDSIAQRFMPKSSAVSLSRQALNTSFNSVGVRLDSVAYGADKNYMAAGASSDSVWLRASASDVSQKEKHNYDGYTAKRMGVMVGYDNQVFANSKLGVALGVVQTKSKERVNNASSSTIKSFQFMPYGSVSLGNRATVGYIDWMAAYSYNDVKAERNVTLGALNEVAKSDYKTSQFGAKAVYALDKRMNKELTLSPFVSAAFNYQSSKTFQETGGSGLNTNMKANSSLEFELGFKGVFKPETGSRANTRLGFRAMGVWSALNDDVTSTSNFILNANTSFETKMKQEKFGGRAGVNVVVELVRNLDMELAYNLEARSKYLDHTGYLEFKYHF